MDQSYLEVTFLRGKPFAAYLSLPRQPDDHSARTEKAGEGLVIDYADDGRPIGLEIISPKTVTLAAINAILERLGQATLEATDFAPLAAA